jgi:tRNA threonylcarbamoyl adenosine modification protein YeaZ
MLLAFDTATHAVTVCLHTGEAGGEVIASSTVVDALRHGELLAPGIQRVLAEAGARPGDLSGIAVGVGPGPFTGLRVGIVTARTMAAVLSIPVYGVCTLDVVAAGVSDQPGGFRVATDARRKEVYWAAYDGERRRLTAPAVDRPDEVAHEGPVAGRGALLYPDAFPRPIQPENPDAADLAVAVAEGLVAILPPEPLYLRRPDAAMPGRPKRVM